MIDLALNGSEIRDKTRVLEISPNPVISDLKKEACLESANSAVLECLNQNVI